MKWLLFFALFVAVMGIVYGFASRGPWSFSAAYHAEVSLRSAGRGPERHVTEADLVHLPEPVRRYVRRSGAVGRPLVRDFSLRWEGRIRGGPDDPWMTFEARQWNSLGDPARFFHMRASRAGVPVDVFHAYRAGSASMRVRLLSLFPIVNASGPEMDRSETVTFFNDLCLFAPSALIDPAIEWEQVDAATVRARYTVAANTIGATLFFDEQGDLVDFVSEDRSQASSDGRTFTHLTWSTPVRGFVESGGRRVSAGGTAIWHTPEGPYAYIEGVVSDVTVNGGAPLP